MQEQLFLDIETSQGIKLHGLNDAIHTALSKHGCKDGFVVITSQHTTTAITINEMEERLLTDIRTFLIHLVPPWDKYLHNDIHLRDCPPDEPENGHAHLMAMLLGNSETIAVADGQLVLGQYQQVMLAELDGPRQRRVSLRFVSS